VRISEGRQGTSRPAGHCYLKKLNVATSMGYLQTTTGMPSSNCSENFANVDNGFLYCISKTHQVNCIITMLQKMICFSPGWIRWFTVQTKPWYREA